MPQTPTEVLDRWKTSLEEMQADAAWMARCQELDSQRLKALREMRELIAKYLKGETNTPEFSLTFQNKAATEWEAFGLKGMNGAMFLDKLVRHIADENRLAPKLRAALKAPQSPEEARNAMRALAAYLEELIARSAVTRSELQPARHAVFLSAWWHIQSPESWPVFFPNTIEAFEREGLFQLKDNLPDSYLEFRQISQALRSALGLNAWQIEHLCVWLNSADKEAPPATALTGQGQGPEPVAPAATMIIAGSIEPAIPETAEPETGSEAEQSAHTQAQWALARIGRKFNCKVWIPPRDRQRIWNNETLGALSLPQLPWLGMDEHAQRIIHMIDVVWLVGDHNIAGAFEVGTSTSIYPGLLRLADLAALLPNLTFPLYMVAPEERLPLVRRELARPVFQAIELHQRCGFFSIEELVREMVNILRWAKDPSAINNLAKKVSSG
jgi:hypothetical protein